MSVCAKVDFALFADDLLAVPLRRVLRPQPALRLAFSLQGGVDTTCGPITSLDGNVEPPPQRIDLRDQRPRPLGRASARGGLLHSDQNLRRSVIGAEVHVSDPGAVLGSSRYRRS